MIFKILKNFTVISLFFLIPFELIAGVTISGGKITGGTINGMTVVEGSNKDNVDNSVQTEEQDKVDEAAEVVENIPEWCKIMPKSDLAIYACGIGNSSNLNMSNSRALLDGKVKLANRIDNQVSSRMSNFLEDIGNSDNEELKQASEIVVKSVSRETQVAGYKELKSDFQSIGNKYQTYVLLEYPIGKANRILYNKIKEDSTLSNQEAADEALAELEAEIDKKISDG